MCVITRQKAGGVSKHRWQLLLHRDIVASCWHIKQRSP